MASAVQADGAPDAVTYGRREDAMALADQVVRYVGEPVAMVIAENRYIAEDAAELVYVDYDGLQAVVDAHEAARNEVLVHAEQGSNVASAYRVGRGDEARAMLKSSLDERIAKESADARTLLDARAAGGDQYPHADTAQTPGNGQADAAVAAGTTDQRHLVLPD